MRGQSFIFIIISLFIIIVAIDVYGFTLKNEHILVKRAEHSEDPSKNARAKLLLDLIGASGNIMKTADSLVNVGRGVNDVGQDIANEDINETIGHVNNAIDSNTKSITDSMKSVSNTTGTISKAFVNGVMTLPRFFVEFAGTIVGASKEK